MPGTGNPMTALVGLSGMFQQLAVSPIKKWQQTSILHQIAAVGAGAGMAYYLHKKGVEDMVVAAAGLGTAYGTSMLMHYPGVVQEAGLLGQGAGQPNALPAGQSEDMAQQAESVLQGDGVFSSPIKKTASNRVPIKRAVGGQDRWALLGEEL
jgi:hypothetical protein